MLGAEFVAYEKHKDQGDSERYRDHGEGFLVRLNPIDADPLLCAPCPVLVEEIADERLGERGAHGNDEVGEGN